MKLARFEVGGKVRWGKVKDDSLILIESPDKPEPLGKNYDLKKAKLLAPAVPSKLICVGLNYVDHAAELKMKLPDEPILFLKPPTAVTGPGGAIVYPSSCTQLDYEAELAVVIGERCKDVGRDEVPDVILGYTCFNDVTARDKQRKDIQWTRAKSFDTFAPVGPWIVTKDEFDPDDVRVMLRLNGKKRQDSRTSQFCFDVPALVEFITGVMTLEKGDVIATGTPPGVGPMKRGDRVEVEVEGIGVLENRVV